MIYYDFHIHSCLSPCGDKDMTPNNLVNMAMLSGLDAIALSDHNSIGNVAACIEVGKSCGITVIPGMEVETAEEVHILTLYPSLDSANEVYKEVYKNLPNIKNRPEIFGEQVFMDCEDNITGYEEKLLISPTTLSMNRLFDMVNSVGGLFIPAHVDRHSYSVLTNLGFILDDLNIKQIEVSKYVDDLKAYLGSRPDLADYFIFRNSDAHYLQDIAQKNYFIDVENISELFGGLK